MFVNSETDIATQQTAQGPEFLSLISQPTKTGLFESIVSSWDKGQGFTLATLNLDHIVKMRQMPEFHSAYIAHTHVVADGNPIVWLSRLAGRSIELMPGSDLIAPLARLAAEHDISVALLGATQDTLDRAADQLEKDNPGLRVVTKIAPPFGLDPDGPEVATYLETIHTEGARLCFLALGAPKQEMLAVRGAQLAPACGFVSIGAGLDFIAGSQTRAPSWVRKLALEWVWRMVSHPVRLATRYGRCLVILPKLLWQALWARFTR
ncbi:WecB/TagA/CpsF family glycosyltransferase [Ruegeria conchae]|uniref:WecB/TagA/CpsF family glycosyltransferase n=1 Tax=Ruegeria conchae TaxID=981384 RepID=UPI0029C88C32|nr:WecB/TagA/CpsF family glycosyltransferase [Ruegeria conchae]